MQISSKQIAGKIHAHTFLQLWLRHYEKKVTMRQGPLRIERTQWDKSYNEIKIHWAERQRLTMRQIITMWQKLSKINYLYFSLRFFIQQAIFNKVHNILLIWHFVYCEKGGEPCIIYKKNTLSRDLGAKHVENKRPQHYMDTEGVI